MGLSPGDLERVPREFTSRDCYGKIYQWQRANGKQLIKSRVRDDSSVRRYLSLLRKLPSPDVASQADMDFVFGEVISNSMEWSYQDTDEQGIKMGAYAQFAIKRLYPNGINDEGFRKSMMSSDLYELRGLESLSSSVRSNVKSSYEEVRSLLEKE